MADRHIDEHLDDGILRLTKVNTDTRQGVSMAVIAELGEAMDRVRDDPQIRCVVIDAGGDGFHNGAVMLGEMGKDWPDLTRADYRRIIDLGHGLGRNIASLDVPVIGVAAAGGLGGGLELLCRSDLVYTTDAARFSFPEVTLGLVAGWGGTQWAGRLIPHRKAQEFLLLGEEIDGRTAEQWGLVTRSLPDRAALDAQVQNVTDRLKRCAPVSVKWHKECLRAIWQKSLTEGEAVEAIAVPEAMATQTWFGPTAAFFEGKGWDYTKNAAISP
ncbi:enoyl-CoA hydratase/isomerase family protein [Sphingomonas sp. SUN019]|uniref:enoyl-CoA hydratase/isomerase family protein n=1 Tax=Sphingomonas sp. SUN019 TaxID=2937788 RepID=UPI002164D707|nr:enoyl-CoA hydratase/isomerase family protein [Sphingomonas sp. SUN019]UVO51994.1 enoyl-CoA hydratase/isomerase family protein [Sphingomonas sp. SUN019]